MAKLIDNKDSMIQFNGEISLDSNYYGGSIIRIAKLHTDYIKFSFTGTSLAIYSQKNVYRSKGIVVDIDGEIYRMDQSSTSTSGPWKVKVFEKRELVNKTHKVKIYMDEETTFRPYDKTFAAELDYIEIDDDAYLVPELSKDYEFPVKTIEKADVEPYAATCINGEEQLLIAIEDGSQYLTKGDGTYLPCGNNTGGNEPSVPKDHTHSALDVEETENRKFITGAEKLAINANDSRLATLENQSSLMLSNYKEDFTNLENIDLDKTSATFIDGGATIDGSSNYTSITFEDDSFINIENSQDYTVSNGKLSLSSSTNIFNGGIEFNPIKKENVNNIIISPMQNLHSSRDFSQDIKMYNPIFEYVYTDCFVDSQERNWIIYTITDKTNKARMIRAVILSKNGEKVHEDAYLVIAASINTYTNYYDKYCKPSFCEDSEGNCYIVSAIRPSVSSSTSTEFKLIVSKFDSNCNPVDRSTSTSFNMFASTAGAKDLAVSSCVNGNHIYAVVYNHETALTSTKNNVKTLKINKDTLALELQNKMSATDDYFCGGIAQIVAFNNDKLNRVECFIYTRQNTTTSASRYSSFSIWILKEDGIMSLAKTAVSSERYYGLYTDLFPDNYFNISYSSTSTGEIAIWTGVSSSASAKLASFKLPNKIDAFNWYTFPKMIQSKKDPYKAYVVYPASNDGSGLITNRFFSFDLRTGEMIDNDRAVVENTLGKDMAVGTMTECENNELRFIYTTQDREIANKIYVKDSISIMSSIKYSVKNNTEQTWKEALPGVPVKFESVGNEITIKAYMETPEPVNNIPSIDSILINQWNDEQIVQTADLITQQIPIIKDTNAKLMITSSQEENSGSIEWMISLDNGVNWYQVNLAESVSLGINTGYVKIKAVLKANVDSEIKPLIKDYNIQTSSIVFNSDLETLQINLMKTNFKIDTFTNASKNGLTNMTIDVFSDENGIDKEVSEYIYDNINKCVHTGTVVTNSEDIEDSVNTILLTSDVIIPSVYSSYQLKDNLVEYFVSKDDGATWKSIVPNVTSHLNELASTGKLRIKMNVVGDVKINAIGYAWK